jgi:hypothetical protein
VLIKIGQRPGIATQVLLTSTELSLHNTNHRWDRTPVRAALPATAAGTPDSEGVAGQGRDAASAKRLPRPRAPQAGEVVHHRDGVSARW